MDSRVTPLQLAAVSGHVQVVRALVGLGADVHSRDQDGQRALDKARNSVMYDDLATVG